MPVELPRPAGTLDSDVGVPPCPHPSGEKGMREGEGWKRVKRRMRKRKTWGEEEGSKTRNELSVEYYYSSKYLKVKKLKYKIDYLGTPRLKIK